MMIETLSGTILSRNFHLTLSTRQNQILPLSIFSERREEITEDVPAPAEDIPAPAPPAPAPPAPAPTLETVEERPHTPGTRKSTCKNFGKPASTYSDSYIQTLSRPGLVDTQYNVGLCKSCK